MFQEFNGYKINGKYYPFPAGEGYDENPDLIVVEDIPFANHPAGKGKRVVARVDISKDTRIGSYAGEVGRVDGDNVDWSPYQLALGKGSMRYVDAACIGNSMRYINDPRGMGPTKPNVVFMQDPDRRVCTNHLIILVVALVDIRAGEELLVSYGDGYWEQLEKWLDEKVPFKCPVSDCKTRYRTQRKANLDRHIESVHTNCLGHACDACDAMFKTSTALTYHVNRVHYGEAKPKKKPNRRKAQCFLCQKILRDNFSLKRHMIRVHDGDRIQCPADAACPATFSVKWDSEKHAKDHHYNEDMIMMMKCTRCSYKCGSEQGMRHHEQLHGTSDEVILCMADEDCPFVCSLESDAKRHARVNHGFLLCDSCTFVCRDEDSMSHHKELHVHKKAKIAIHISVLDD